MDRRQKKRILIFLIIPVLAAVLFFTDDLLVRVIAIALIIIYVAFIIFLRDSVRFDGRYSINDRDEVDEDLVMDVADLVDERLEKQGYHKYEISNYAKTGKESQHNLIYWNLEEYWNILMN